MNPLIHRSFFKALEKIAFNQEQIRQQGAQMVQQGTAMQQNPLAAMSQIRQHASLTANNPAAKPAQAAQMMSLVQSTQPGLHKTAADTEVLRRAARKLVFSNKKLRTRVRKYIPAGYRNAEELMQFGVDRARRDLKRGMARPETEFLDWADADKLRDLVHLRDKGPTLPAGGYSRLATAKKEMPGWIRKAKAEAHTAGEPRAWRDYLPRHVDRMQQDRAHLNEAKKLRESAPQQIAKIMERARAGKHDEVLALRDDLGRIAGGTGIAAFDPNKNKIMVEGFREVHPAQRATSALHEFNEFLEAKRYAKKGRPFDQVRTTNQVLGPGNVHANATLPVRDLNIARTVTGDGAKLVREEFENLRAVELDAMKRKMPQLAPMLSQLEGQGTVYGKSSPTKALTRAQNILSSGGGSPALRGRAQKIVDTHAAGQVPNVRLNRREVNHVRDTYDRMFQPPIIKTSAYAFVDELERIYGYELDDLTKEAMFGAAAKMIGQGINNSVGALKTVAANPMLAANNAAMKVMMSPGMQTMVHNPALGTAMLGQQVAGGIGQMALGQGLSTGVRVAGNALPGAIGSNINALGSALGHVV